MTKSLSEPFHPAQGRGALGAQALALSWTAFVVGAFFFSPDHPVGLYLPYVASVFDPGPLPAGEIHRAQVWEESAFILLTALLAVAMTFSLGSRLRRWLSLAAPDPWVRWAVDFGLGVVGLDLFWTGAGLTGLWYPPVWTAGGLALLTLTLFDGGTLARRGLPRSGFQWIAKEPGLFLLLALGAFFFLFSVLQDLAPETFYDSMVYHLAVPSYWLLHHGLADFPTNFYSNYPFGAELYFLGGMVAQGTEAAKMLNLAAIGACALLAGGWARETAGERAGRFALGLVLTFPLFVINGWSTQVDGMLALAATLFAYALSRFLKPGGQQAAWGLTAGLFAGLALSVKYTAMAALAGAVIALAASQKSILSRQNRETWWGMAGACLLLALPWALKNLCYTGDPVFPYLMSHIGGRQLPPAGFAQLLKEQRNWLAPDWKGWLALPWTLTMGPLSDNGFCGPLPLALGPLLLLFRMRHPTLRFLAWLLPLQLASGLLLTQVARFLLPAFAVLCVLLGCALGGDSRPLLGKGAFYAAVLAAFLTFPYLATMSQAYFSCAGVWAGQQTRAQYLNDPARRSPYFTMAEWASGNLPKDAGLLIVGDARGLYYERPFRTASTFDEQVMAGLARREKDAAGILRRLREMGVDYLAVNGIDGVQVANNYPDYDLYDLSQDQWKKLDDFIQEGTRLVRQWGAQGVYQILPSLGPRPESETQDLILCFSKPAAHFIFHEQKHQVEEAENDIRQAVALYPFSRFWREQKERFENP